MASARKRVLILDHDEDLLLRLEQLLEHEGVATDITWDAQQAMDMMQRHSYDLLILGHHPPEVDAVGVLRQLTPEKNPGCVILQSGAQYPFEQEYLQSLGARAVLSKHEEAIGIRVRQMLPVAS